MNAVDYGYSSAQVLVVDDEPDVLSTLADALTSHGYGVHMASSAETGLEMVRHTRLDLVLCDLYMDGMSGVQFTEAVRRIHPQLPVVVITAWGDIEASRLALEAGASDFVTKPIEFSTLPLLLENNLQRKRIEIGRVSDQRADVLLKTVKALAAAVDSKSRYAEKHSAHMAELCLEIGRELGLSEDQMNTLELAAHIHDVGKIRIPDSVLVKPGDLTPEEWADILQHPATGADFLSEVDELGEVASIIRHHHERMDGSGYPDGLSGEAVPFLARILAAADAFEAMTSDRPHRPAASWEEAIEELKAHADTQFDPAVVRAAERVVRRALGLDPNERAA